jgi:hypothetical protein
MILFLALLVVFAAFFPVAHCHAGGPIGSVHRSDYGCIAEQEFSHAALECCELHAADDGDDWHHYHFLFESASCANQLRIDDQAPRANSVYAVVDTHYCPDAKLKLCRAAVLSPLPGYFQPQAIPTGLSPPC